MSNDAPPPPRPALNGELKRDMILDTLGNTALALGLWGWLARDGDSSGWLHEPAVFIALTATGVLNLLHLPARFRRLRAWRDAQR